MTDKRALTFTISGGAGAGKTSAAIWLARALREVAPRAVITIEDDDLEHDDANYELISEGAMPRITHATIRTVQAARALSPTAMAGMGVALADAADVANRRAISTWPNRRNGGNMHNNSDPIRISFPEADVEPGPKPTDINAARRRFTRTKGS